MPCLCERPYFFVFFVSLWEIREILISIHFVLYCTVSVLHSGNLIPMSLTASLKKNADCLIAALAGFVIIFLFTRHGGIGISPDSVIYSSAAENLHSHGKLTAFTQDPVVEFPPFYPIFLSVIMLLTGLKPLLFAPVLNALLFAVVIYLSGQMMNRFSNQSKWYKWAMLVCIVLSSCLLEVYSMIWTETLFIIWILLFMIAMRRYFQSYSRRALIIAAAIAAFATVTRYAGVTLIATGGILLLLDTKLPPKRKWTNTLLFAVISPLLLMIELARNYAVSGTLTGMREKSITPLNVNIHDAGSVFCDWLPFLHGHYTGAGWVAVCITGGLGWLCVKRFLRNGHLTTFENMAAGFSLLYVLFMIVTASISRFEPLDSRFFSPVFIPMLWSGSSWIVPAVQKTKRPVKKWLMILAVGLFLSFQYNQLVADYETWDAVKDIGIPGYTEDDWKYSETVQFIQQDSLPFQKNYTIYSNSYDAIYFFTGRPGKFLPHKEFKKEVEEFLDDRHCYLVWFNDGENPDLVEMDFIINTKKMRLVKEFEDGAIYEFDVTAEAQRR
jgi:hypothetical protein